MPLRNSASFFLRSKDDISVRGEMDVTAARYVDFADLIFIAQRTGENLNVSNAA